MIRKDLVLCIVERDKTKKVISVKEKSLHPKSNYYVTGLCFYDHHVVEYAKQLKLKPSIRNKLVITDLNWIYLELGIEYRIVREIHLVWIRNQLPLKSFRIFQL